MSDRSLDSEGMRTMTSTFSRSSSSISSRSSSAGSSSDCKRDVDDPSEDPALLRRVAAELEELRGRKQICDGTPGMPYACRRLLLSLPGNRRCVDCGAPNPDWASVSFGALLCVCCSGKHRSYGVATSRVRSVSMDAWSFLHVLQVLEGGNAQLQGFFRRHELGTTQEQCHHEQRYRTRAAAFYRTHLAQHADAVGGDGPYQGRSASRKQQQQQQQRKRSQQQNLEVEDTTAPKESVNENEGQHDAPSPPPTVSVRRPIAVQ